MASVDGGGEARSRSSMSGLRPDREHNPEEREKSSRGVFHESSLSSGVVWSRRTQCNGSVPQKPWPRWMGEWKLLEALEAHHDGDPEPPAGAPARVSGRPSLCDGAPRARLQGWIMMGRERWRGGPVADFMGVAVGGVAALRLGGTETHRYMNRSG